jgi:CBS domain containing-hemolysin-like protein
MDAINTRQLILLAAVFLLILINAFFVAAEFSLVTARRTRIEQMAARGNRLAGVLLRAMDNPNVFISAAQIGITMASLGIGWLGEPAVATLFEGLFAYLPAPWRGIASHTTAVVLAFALITLLEVILGEQVPKMIAIQRAEGTALLTAQLTQFVSVLFRPLIFVIYWTTELILRPYGLQYHAESHLVYTVEELEMLVAASEEKGEIEASEREMIERLLTFADIAAHMVMVPRTEMIAVPVTITLPRLMETIAREGRSRYPVYSGSLDDIIGVVHSKDLFKFLVRTPQAPFNIRNITREVLNVPESLPIDQLLMGMKSRRIHVAIVIDEYGGTAGMVTMEDLMERIVGEVQDEFEQPEIYIEQLPNGDALINGLVLIEEVNERFGLHLPTEEFDTIGGYVFGRLGRKPEIGDSVQADSYTFRVDALDGLRISRLYLERTSEVPAAPAESEGG